MFWNRQFGEADEEKDSIKNIDQEVDDDDYSVPIELRTKGSLLDMPSLSTMKTRRANDGLIRAIKNFPMRGHQWKFTCSCSNAATGDFAVADDRGQVYVLNVDKNSYQLVRSASNTVCAIAFIPCRQNQLIVAYESGQVLLLDTETKETLGNLQNEGTGLAPVRMISTHPTKAMVLLVGEDCLVSIWNIRSMRCLRTLECDEPIIDVQYVLDGNVMLLVLQETGAYVYRAKDCQVMQHCPLPHSERTPSWVSLNFRDMI